MRNKYKRIWQYSFYVLLVLVFVYYFLNNKNELLSLLKINLLLLIPIVLLQYITIFINGIITKEILKSFNKTMGIIESFYVALLSAIGNYFGPFLGGAGVRAVYLKKKYRLKYSHFMSTLSGNHIMVILINSIFGLAALYMLGDLNSYNTQIVFILLATMLITSSVVVLFGVPVKFINLFRRSKIFKKAATVVTQMTEGWNKIVNNRRLLYDLSSLIIVNFFVSVLLIYTELAALDIGISFGALILYNVLGTVSLLVSITPGSLGIREGILIFASGAIGLSASQIVAIAVIDRGSRFFVLGTGWLASSLIGNKKSRSKTKL